MTILGLTFLALLDQLGSASISTWSTQRNFSDWISNTLHLSIFHQSSFAFVSRLPPSFNYTKSIKQRGQVMKYRFKSKNPKGGYPMKVTEHGAGFFGIMHTNGNLRDMKPFKNHHESFVQQGVNYFIHSPYEVLSKDSAHHRTVVNHSLIVYVNPQKTILDGPLENYKPFRFSFEFMQGRFP
jgi:hypothetical protein